MTPDNVPRRICDVQVAVLVDPMLTDGALSLFSSFFSSFRILTSIDIWEDFGF